MNTKEDLLLDLHYLLSRVCSDPTCLQCRKVEAAYERLNTFISAAIPSEPDMNQFVCSWGAVQLVVHELAVAKHWHDKPRTIGDFIALLHSELSEALEWARADNPKSDHIPAYSGIEEELADVVIRIMDLAQISGWDVSGAIEAKIAYNKTRSDRHGGKLF